MIQLALAAIVSGSLMQSVVEGRLLATNLRVRGAVVYLVSQHGDQTRMASDTVVLDQRGLRFVPQVMAVEVGTTVAFHNSDPVQHNVFSPPGVSTGFDLGMYPDTEVRYHTFERVGAHTILCNVHPEMAAFVVVVPTPHAAVVDSAGLFRIDHVPPGQYVLHVWHSSGRTMEMPLIIGPEPTKLRLRLPRR